MTHSTKNSMQEFSFGWLFRLVLKLLAILILIKIFVAAVYLGVFFNADAIANIKNNKNICYLTYVIGTDHDKCLRAANK